MIHYALPDTNPDRTRKGFSAVDIPLPSEACNASEILLTGRYPAAAYALNATSEMVVRVLEGETVFECEGERVVLPQGATVLVQTNRRYCWEPRNFVRLFVVSTPPWTPEQHRLTPESEG